MVDQVEIHRMARSEDVDERKRAEKELKFNFAILNDKKQAWDDLIRLTQYNNDFVRIVAAHTLGGCYPHIPEEFRKQAWYDLHSLTQYNNDHVRRGVAYALGSCYPRIPGEYGKQAWYDLHRLTQDKDAEVRVAANHSSGRVSIYRASQAKDDESVRKELEIALRFFEKSSNESTCFNPAKFCLPFYRSFYSITFRKEDAEAEVQRYLSEANSVVEGSESKEKLLEAVENLGNALREAQKTRDFKARETVLNACRRYIDRACELLDTTEDKAPGASRLIRRGLPIIDERIKGIIAEIQEKARALCKQVKDTEYKEIGQQVNNVGQELSKVIDPIRLEKEVSRMLIPISAMCKKMPEEDRGEACMILKQINDEQNIEDKLPLISMFLSKISTQMNQKKEQNMSININSSGTQSRVNIGSVDKSTNIITGNLETDLENLKNLIESDYHREDKPELVQEVDQIKKTCTDSSKKNTLKEKRGWILTRTSEVSSISSLVMALLQTYTGT